MARRPWATSDGAGTTARGYGWVWQQLVERIRSRDCDICQTCVRRGNGPIRLYAAIDHKVPKSQGGSDDESNLEVICLECHDAKTTKEHGGTKRAAIGRDGWPIG